MNHIQKHLNEFFRDITAIGGFAASVLLILLFISSPLLIPLIAGSVITAGVIVLIRIFYFKNRPKKETYHTFWERIDASSFPSLHTARIVFLAILFSAYFSNRYLSILCAITAALVSYSRIYLKKHDWWDLAGGVVLGAATYFLVIKIF
ncbi:MAG TPA: phosphatase PAP2 family protein [Candidatus Nanoarchaeia archaeon]|nr:phosphatase PAP2 family protein [Candidatus Nanoarchaeia archaeon]